jgi:hypothetical protein
LFKVFISFPVSKRGAWLIEGRAVCLGQPSSPAALAGLSDCLAHSNSKPPENRPGRASLLWGTGGQPPIDGVLRQASPLR